MPFWGLEPGCAHHTSRNYRCNACLTLSLMRAPERAAQQRAEEERKLRFEAGPIAAIRDKLLASAISVVGGLILLAALLYVLIQAFWVLFPFGVIAGVAYMVWRRRQRSSRQSNPPAGWYQNPENDGYERWFNGSSWTDQVR